MEFEWDPAKATANFARHGVTIEEALTVFMDPLARIHEDPDHSEAERREIIVGHSIDQRHLLVSFAERGERVRLISAGPSTKKERRDYEEKGKAQPAFHGTGSSEGIPLQLHSREAKPFRVTI